MSGTPPYAWVLASIGGGANQHGAITATNGQTVALTAESTAFWGSPAARWEIYEYPQGFAVPAGWSTDATSGAYYYLGNAPPGWTLPAGPTFGKFMLSLVVNGGVTDGVSVATLTDISTAIEIVSASGFHDLAYRETNQFGTQRKWVEHQKTNIRLLETAVGGFAAATNLIVASVAAKRDSSGGCNFAYIKSSDTTTAASGSLRTRNATVAVAARNAADSADIDALTVDGSDNVIVGDGTDAANVHLTPKDGGRVRITRTAVAQLDLYCDATYSYFAVPNKHLYINTATGRVEIAASADSILISSATTVNVKSGSQIWSQTGASDVAKFDQRYTSVQTVNATVTTLATIAIPDNTTVRIVAEVTGDIAAAGANSGGYTISATVKRNGAGVATMVTGSPTQSDVHEDNAAWDATIDVDGANNARVRVTGVAATTIDWNCLTRIVW
jgi:hypothetical protein